MPDEETNTSRPPWGNNLVGTAVKVSVVGAWLNAEVVEVDTDHDGARGVFVRYADYRTRTPARTTAKKLGACGLLKPAGDAAAQVSKMPRTPRLRVLPRAMRVVARA